MSGDGEINYVAISLLWLIIKIQVTMTSEMEVLQAPEVTGNCDMDIKCDKWLNRTVIACDVWHGKILEPTTGKM